MDFQQWLDQSFIQIGEHNVTVFMFILSLLLVVLVVLVYLWISRRYLPRFYRKRDMSPVLQKRINRTIKLLFGNLGLILLVYGLRLNFSLALTETFSLSILTILEALFIILLTILINYIITRGVIDEYYAKRDGPDDKGKIMEGGISPAKVDKIIRNALFAIAMLVIINNFNLDFQLFEIPRVSGVEGQPNIPITPSKLLYAIFIFFLTQISAWILIQLILYGYYRRKKVEAGAQYAINQLLTYVVYVIGILVILQIIGFKITVILGGIAALLVGIGLGLQQTFNDLVSGIILLFERHIEVGDVVEINGEVGTVRKIGLRASHVETRDRIMVIVPNSKLVVDNVVNWSHLDNKVRFHLTVGVAYGSDTQLVKDLLIKAANDCPYVLEYPQPIIRFYDFGNSSLGFDLLFWSRNFIIIEDVKSDIRFEIDRLFRKHRVTIAFPQRDVHIYQKTKEDV